MAIEVPALDGVTQGNLTRDVYENVDYTPHAAITLGTQDDYRVSATRGNFKSHICYIPFQVGNPAVVGKTGVTLEELMAICIHRLELKQKTQFACSENENAIGALMDAVEWLKVRAGERQARGVLGTDQA